MENLGITKCIIVPNFTPSQKQPFEEFNPIILDIVSKLDNVYGGLWVSPIEENTIDTKKVLEMLPAKNIKVLKIHADSWGVGIGYNPKNWTKEFKVNMDEIIKTVKDNNLVLHLHTGSKNSDFIKEVIPFIKYAGKDVKLQLVHMGGSNAGGVLAFAPRFIELLKEGYNLYCDTSCAMGFGQNWLINKLLKEYPSGISRVLFGSDNPWGMFEGEFWKIEGANISDDIKNDIFYNNAIKLYE